MKYIMLQYIQRYYNILKNKIYNTIGEHNKLYHFYLIPLLPFQFH